MYCFKYNHQFRITILFHHYNLNLYFICLAQSLKCHVNSKNAESIKIESKECKPDHVCGYTTKEGQDTIVRECISKQNESYPKQIFDGKCFKTGDPIDKKGIMICTCDTDNCNHKCSAVNCQEGGTKCDANCKAPGEGPEKKVTKQLKQPLQTKQNRIQLMIVLEP